MANNLSNYLENAILNWIKGSAFPAAPGTVYLALFTTLPAEDGTGGVEVAGGAYARQAVAFGALAGQPPAISNSGAIAFPDATADWGTIAGVAVMDAAAAGNLLVLGPPTANRTILSGDRVVVDATTLSISVD